MNILLPSAGSKGKARKRYQRVSMKILNLIKYLLNGSLLGHGVPQGSILGPL
jgi:hypothetical protein